MGDGCPISLFLVTGNYALTHQTKLDFPPRNTLYNIFKTIFSIISGGLNILINLETKL